MKGLKLPPESQKPVKIEVKRDVWKKLRIITDSHAEFSSISATIESLLKDRDRIEWLGDTSNTIGNVELPNDCVVDGLEGGLRLMIDLAMEKD